MHPLFFEIMPYWGCIDHPTPRQTAVPGETAEVHMVESKRVTCIERCLRIGDDALLLIGIGSDAAERDALIKAGLVPAGAEERQTGCLPI